MSEAKFTKGPWVVYDEAVSVSFYGTECRPGVESDAGEVIIVFGSDKYDCSGVHGETQDQVKANAHLIAAAPEMYEFIKSLQLDVSKEAEAEDLLARARGENV